MQVDKWMDTLILRSKTVDWPLLNADVLGIPLIKS